jgi:hypothetical protein
MRNTRRSAAPLGFSVDAEHPSVHDFDRQRHELRGLKNVEIGTYERFVQNEGKLGFHLRPDKEPDGDLTAVGKERVRPKSGSSMPVPSQLGEERFTPSQYLSRGCPSYLTTNTSYLTFVFWRLTILPTACTWLATSWLC